MKLYSIVNNTIRQHKEFLHVERGIDSKESQIYINVLTSLINDGDIKSTKKN